MENEENNLNQTEENTGPSPEQIRSMLMDRARLLGVEFSNNIGTDTLRQRIADKLAEKEKPPVVEDEKQPEPNALEETAKIADAKDTVEAVPEKAEKKERPVTLREKLYRDNMKLVRCRIQNLDPKKKDLHGEVFAVANEFIGTVRKFVPYGEVTDDGFHIPYVIYKQLIKRKFLNIRTIKDKHTGTNITKTAWAKEFSIDVLDPLTEKELEQLKTAQIAAGSIDNEG